ncbi:MAG: HupE/UreJ family protein [Verrucomicrobiales bacterium]
MRRPFLYLLVVIATGFHLLTAHEMHPGYLELEEKADQSIDVTWKLPFFQGEPLPIQPRFPKSWENLTEPTHVNLGNASLHRWRVRTGSDGLPGSTIAIEGPPSQLTDVLLRAQLHDGRTTHQVLRPESTTAVLNFENRTPLLWSYVLIGIEHILFGFDHLLFVLCLVLLVGDLRKLIATITAFTLAHSITLGISTLGWLQVPGPPVEAVIALSIVFLARELALRNEEAPGLTERYPWLVAVSFGLLHGFGFAGALSEVGLPENQIPIALFNFNLGVELGQLAFIAVMLAGIYLTRKISPTWNERARQPVIFATGILAAYWCVERITGFWA